MVEIVLPNYMHHLIDMRVAYWYCEEGDPVEANTDLVEITSEEGVYRLTASMSGVLDEVYIQNGDSVGITDVLGIIVNPSDDTNYRENNESTETTE